MKLLLALCFILLLSLTAPGQSRISVMTDTNGVLLVPTSFFRANANALNAVVTHPNVGGGTNLSVTYTTNVTFTTNVTYVVTNIYNITNAAAPASVKTGYETNLYAYYKLDEDSTATALTDWAGGFSIPTYGGIQLLTAGGKLGTAMNMGDSGVPTFRSGLTTHFSFSGHDWTIRLWVNLDGTTAGNRYIDFAGIYIAHDTPQTVLVRLDRAAGEHYEIQSAALTTGIWHRVVVWQKSGVEMGMKIDDDPSVTLAAPEVLYDWGSQRCLISDVASADLVELYDEIAVWKDYVLTEADMTLDWNNGTGRTYPLP